MITAHDVSTCSMNAEFPKLPTVYAVVFWIVIGANLLLIWELSRIGLVRPGRFAIAAAIILPCCATTAIQQYRGAFRYVPFAGSMTCVILFVISGALLFGAFAEMTQLVDARGRHLPRHSVILPLLVAGVMGLAAARMNAKWAQRVRAVLVASPDSHRPRIYTLQGLLSLITAVALLAGFAVWWDRLANPRIAEHVVPSEVPFILPPGASDVCYRLSPRGPTWYEFTVDEKTLRSWIEERVEILNLERGVEAIEEIDVPVGISRYAGRATVYQGLCYASPARARGRDFTIEAAFDRAQRRAYFAATLR